MARSRSRVSTRTEPPSIDHVSICVVGWACRVIMGGIDVCQKLSGVTLKLLAFERMLSEYPNHKEEVGVRPFFFCFFFLLLFFVRSLFCWLVVFSRIISFFSLVFPFLFFVLCERFFLYFFLNFLTFFFLEFSVSGVSILAAEVRLVCFFFGRAKSGVCGCHTYSRVGHTRVATRVLTP